MTFIFYGMILINSTIHHKECKSTEEHCIGVSIYSVCNFFSCDRLWLISMHAKSQTINSIEVKLVKNLKLELFTKLLLLDM